MLPEALDVLGYFQVSVFNFIFAAGVKSVKVTQDINDSGD